ncbi:MAG TPA: hypothetical protein VEH05_14515 [Streptosporangiaceae bacterium]|nr:hypothetical protein [Streptosporangiaceae bacterium]
MVTGWVQGTEIVADDLSAGAARRLSDVAVYRRAVAGVLAELAAQGRGPNVATAERVLDRRLREAEFAMVLSATPSGPEAAIQRILRDVRSYRRRSPNSAGDLAAMVRITLLTQIDVLWWGHLRPYKSDADVLAAPELLDLDVLRSDGKVAFNYRRQATTLLGRAVRTAERAAVPGHAPATAGLRFALARAELIVVLNQIAVDFARLAPSGTPRLWVTSLVRSVAYQRQLRGLGYAALLPSAHCVGYAADLEMSWFRQFDADHVLRAVLIAHQRDGDVNVIDEGQAWHVCVRPGAGRALRLIPRQR